MIFYPEEVCGRVLFELSPKAESVKASRELFESCDELKDALASPAVEIKEKEKVIDRLFPEDMRNFLKVMCQWGHMDNIMDIFDAYDEEVLKSKNILKAELYCVCPPEKAQTDKIKETLKKKYGVSDVLLEVNTDEALMGGYRLEVNGVEYDKGTVSLGSSILTGSQLISSSSRPTSMGPRAACRTGAMLSRIISSGSRSISHSRNRYSNSSRLS